MRLSDVVKRIGNKYKEHIDRIIFGSDDVIIHKYLNPLNLAHTAIKITRIDTIKNEDYLKVDGAILVKKENVNKLENTVTTVYSFGDGICLAFVNFCGLASKIFDKIDLIFKLSL